jgi:prepilin-type N-terminal cleavage/methylation domain-containing protein
MRTITTTQKGFTLVEMIVAIFVFSVVMVISTGALVSIIGANRKAQSVKSVMNNVAFSLDSMTRALRVGTNYDCGVSSCASGGSESLTFTDVDGRDVQYRFNESSNQIERDIDGAGFQALTAPEVTVDRLMFYVDGVESDGQPRVLIVVGGRAGVGKSETVFNIQTLVSQRSLDR